MSKQLEFKANLTIDGLPTWRVVVADDDTLQTHQAVIKRTGEKTQLSRRDYKAFKRWHEKQPDDAYEKKLAFISRRKKKRQVNVPLEPHLKLVSGGLPGLGRKK
jgi:hypothetical protein